MMEKLSEICQMPIQLAVLGSGEASIEEKMAQLEEGNRGKIAFYKGYNDSLAHRIYAACDMFLMPSLFEPCGISPVSYTHLWTLEGKGKGKCLVSKTCARVKGLEM